MDDALDRLFARQPTSALDVSLTAADNAAFEAHGFVSIPRITTDEEVAWLRELYDWLFASKAEAVRGGYFDLARPYDSEGEDLLPQLLTPEHRFPQLRQTTFWRNGRRLAAQLMQVDEALLRGWGHMIRKPALVGEALPWHQDEAYWDPAMIYRALGCWLPLDDATVENGCMSYIPGSHVAARCCRIGTSETTRASMPCSRRRPWQDVARAVPCRSPPAALCSTTAAPCTSSGPNTTDKARRAYANEWQLAPVKAEVAPKRDWIDDGSAAWAARSLT